MSQSLARPRVRAIPLDATLTVAVLAFAVYVLTPTMADPDLWGHLRFGADTLASGLARVDPYSYTATGAPWINHEWLAEVIFALLYRVGTLPLVGLKLGIGLVVLGLAAHELRRQGASALRVPLALLVLAWLTSYALSTVRPQMFTVLGVALVALTLSRHERGEWSLWPLGPLFLVWANLHGGFLAGVGLLGLYQACRLIRGRLALRDLPPTALVFLATLATPYGPDLWRFLLATALVPRPEITEWAPLALGTTQGLGYLLTLGLFGYALHRHPPSLERGCLLVVLALLPLTATRHTALFGIGALFLAAPAYAELPPLRLTLSEPAKALLLALSAVLLFASILLPWRLWIVPSADLPTRQIALLSQTTSPASIALHFDWGEQVIASLGPRVRVSVDGRRETVYPADAYQQSQAFEHGVGDWRAILERADTAADLVLVQPRSAPANLLRLEPGWRVVSEDGIAVLFVRVGSAIGDELLAATS